MKVRVKIAEGTINVDGVLEGATEVDLFQRMRNEIAKRLNFVQRAAMTSLSDQMLMRKIVEAYNSRHSKSEQIPTTYQAFLAFAERCGYIERMA